MPFGLLFRLSDNKYLFAPISIGRISIAESKGLIPLVEGQDVQCYNYSLPYSFASVPSVAIGMLFA